MSDEAFVTLVASDNYVLGGLTLAYSLRETNTQRKLVCLVTHKVSQTIRDRLAAAFDEVVAVSELNSNDSVNLDLLCRPELGITFTKLFIWKLTQYKKTVFLDADTLVLKNVDELFDREEFSAAPDVGWPDCFNSGVFVCVPNLDTFHELVELSENTGSFDGGDQGLLNEYFCDWSTKDIHKHLPFVFNLNANATYFYAPAYKRYGKDAKIVHFIGAAKPWMHARDANGVLHADNAEHLVEHLDLWWACHDRHVQDINLPQSFYPEEYVPSASAGRQQFSTQWYGGVASHSSSHSTQPPASGFAAIEAKLNEAMGGKREYKQASPTTGAQNSGGKVPAAGLSEELESKVVLKKKPEESA
ncbi:hypothetical protein SARC_00763 [Sphaeroforma arctica JP610]|uniref:glycogenin glucosyltransferase n=1 Tax=Sphaeroforma arctica JP610 TaxID=667725 RepID=A0A0L0GDL4_9EUKA|nr:hypothetical protein SARC_00763 [Sphaeroforma arctica JP610]KNC87087.1 hypothetical protein SARC_00763 [Sphaeroforma arctica JP610]|eukprot:XP_014160989.1 hypothetical protein SARC_00763 [Sphaeroforma arctica JP610]